MRHALRLLCAAAVLLLPAVAAAQFSYQPAYYRPFPPPVGYQPPATPFFYAPPVAHIGGHGFFGSCGGSWGASCVRPAPVPCCYRPPTICCSQAVGYGYGGYGFGGYTQAQFNSHYGYQHHYGNHPPHMPPPRRMSKTPAPTPVVQGPTQSYAQAYYSSPAYAQWYAAYGQAFAAHQKQAVTRLSAAARPKPTALRGASKPLPALKPVADASSATK